MKHSNSKLTLVLCAGLAGVLVPLQSGQFPNPGPAVAENELQAIFRSRMSPEQEAVARALLRQKIKELEAMEIRGRDLLHDKIAELKAADQGLDAAAATMPWEREVQLRALLHAKMDELRLAEIKAASLVEQTVAQLRAREETLQAGLSPEREAEARRLLREKIAELNANETHMLALLHQTIDQLNSAPTGRSQVVVAEPLPKTREEQLAELLEQYKADRISPRDYYAARSKLVADLLEK